MNQFYIAKSYITENFMEEKKNIIHEFSALQFSNMWQPDYLYLI